MKEVDILEEIYAHREEFAKRHNYDLRKMMATVSRIRRRPDGTVYWVEPAPEVPEAGVVEVSSEN